jgi:hypothetical protein
MEALRDVVWRLLTERGIAYKYQPAFYDGMPMPKPEYFVPLFNLEAWDQMMATIGEAQELLKA